MSLTINTDISEKDKEGLKRNGVVFLENGKPYFQLKEASIPEGMMRLRSGRVIPRESLPTAYVN